MKANFGIKLITNSNKIDFEYISKIEGYSTRNTKGRSVKHRSFCGRP